MPRKSKGIYRKCSIDAMQEAVNLVKSGELSVRRAAVKFGIRPSTLGDHVSGKIPVGKLSGKASVFTESMEHALVQKAELAAEVGLGITRQQMMAKAAILASRLKLKTPFKNDMPGQAWWDGFRARNPSLALRKPEKLPSVRARNLNAVTLDKYFSDLAAVLDDLQLRNAPDRIWNMDETGCQMEHTPVAVCARRGSKNVPGIVSNSRESVTILPCVSAIGRAMPPMIIVKGKTEKSLNGFNKGDGPLNAEWTFQGKAWIEEAGAVRWFTKVFLQNCGVERPQLIILDQHVAHEALEFIEAARENDIHLFGLPPHTTHFLCPLDRAVFGPLKSNYNKVCSVFISSALNQSVMKWNWSGLFRKAYDAAFTESNIKQGFKACGIFPLDPTAIPQAALTPSIPTDREIAQTTTSTNTVTPVQIPDTMSTNTTPPSNEEEIVITNTAPPSNEEIFTIDTTTNISNLQLLSDLALGGLFLDKTLEEADIVSLENPVTGNGVIVSMGSEANAFSLATNSQVIPEAAFVPCTESGADPLWSSTMAPDHSSTVDWNIEINNLFTLNEGPNAPLRNQQKRKRATSHRLLTSDVVLENKRQQREEKERKRVTKQENMEKRKTKALSDFMKKMK